jgi:hypothetical protein
VPQAGHKTTMDINTFEELKQRIPPDMAIAGPSDLTSELTVPTYHRKLIKIHQQRMVCQEIVHCSACDSLIVLVYRKDPHDLPKWINADAYVFKRIKDVIHKENLAPSKIPQHHRYELPERVGYGLPSQLPFQAQGKCLNCSHQFPVVEKQVIKKILATF